MNALLLVIVWGVLSCLSSSTMSRYKCMVYCTSFGGCREHKLLVRSKWWTKMKVVIWCYGRQPAEILMRWRYMTQCCCSISGLWRQPMLRSEIMVRDRACWDGRLWFWKTIIKGRGSKLSWVLWIWMLLSNWTTNRAKTKILVKKCQGHHIRVRIHSRSRSI